MKELFLLFYYFAKIGLFTFGGGLAMLPMIKKEVVEKNKWATEEEIMNYYAIGQCTPGIIAVNTATFVGYKRKGISGGIFATLGVVFPSVVIILIIAALISNFSSISYVQYAFSGIRVAVSVLVFDAVIKFIKSGVKNIITFLIFLVSLILALIFDISSIYLVLGGILLGTLIGERGKK